jgi:hypothetical protein
MTRVAAGQSAANPTMLGTESLPPCLPVSRAVCYLFLFGKTRSIKREGAWIMGARRIRREQRQVDQRTSRITNGAKKVKERARRDSRMLDTVKKGSLPFTPAVMSWLSVKLNKPSRLITKEDLVKVK